MATTYWQLFTKIVNQIWLSNTFSDGSEETASIKNDIRDIQNEVLTFSKPYNTKSWVLISWWSVAWQNNYDIPATVDKISFIKITSWGIEYFPEEISINEFQTLLNNSSSTSDIPVFFTIDKNQVYIYPTPASNSLPIELNSNEYATDLNIDESSTTDQNTSLAIKIGYINVYYYYCLSQAYMRLEDVWLADRYELKFEKLLKKYQEDVDNPTNNPVVKSWRSMFINPNNYPTIT